MTAIQISVFLENKSGRLSEVTQTLARADINIRALSLAETIDYGVLRLIVNKPKEAKAALTEAGFTVTETEVIAVAMPDRPGGPGRAGGSGDPEGAEHRVLLCVCGETGGQCSGDLPSG